MNKILSSLIALISVSSCVAQSAGSATPYLTKTFPDNSFRKVMAVCSHGDIELQAVESGEAKVEVFITGRENNVTLSKERIRDLLDEYYRLDVSVNDGVLTAAVKQTKDFFNGRRSLSISFRIYTGKAKSGDLETSHGNLRLAGLTGGQKLLTDHGDIDAADVAGQLNAKTSHGNIKVTGAGENVDAETDHGDLEIRDARGDARLSTSNGNIQVNNVKGKVHADTDHGDVAADNIGGDLISSTSHGNISANRLSGAVEASTDHGNLNISVDRLSGNVTLKNSGGDIDLRLPKDAGVDLDLRGRKVVTRSIDHFSGSSKDESVSGTLNGGGAKVYAKTDRGQVDLSFR